MYCYPSPFQYEFVVCSLCYMMKKTIIQFLPYSYHIHTGGLEKIAQTLSDGFNTQADISCINIASDVRRWYTGAVHDTDDTKYISSWDIVYNYPIPKFRSKKFWQTLSWVKKQQPAAIQTHTRFFLQSMIGWLYAKWIGCKRVHVEHGSGFVTGYPWYIRAAAWLFDWTIGWWIFRSCDTIVTISQAHKQFIQKFTSKEPIVIYNPIDYIPQKKVTNTIPHIWFVGRLVSIKGIDILIQALKQLENKEWICSIIGEWDQRKTLEKLTQELWLQDRISFVWADDRANWLHRFDIFVNPSHQEWLPTTVVEAILAQCIVVATDVGGTSEISDRDDLIIVRPGQVDTIVEWLQVAFARLEKSGDSYEVVMKKFGVESALSAYKKILF